jgi:hypothetical protein
MIVRRRFASSGDVMNARMLQTIVLVSLGSFALGWFVDRGLSPVSDIRELGRNAVAQLRSDTGGEGLSDPLRMFQASLAEAAPAEARVRGTIYVPAYSAIRAGSGRGRIDLATTLSIHNTSREKPLLLERIDYHNTEGELVQSHLDQPVALKPLGTIEVFVANADLRGGTGANFMIDWAAHGPISEPVAEAVMIGTQGTTSYSFVSQGRAIRMVGPNRS